MRPQGSINRLGPAKGAAVRLPVDLLNILKQRAAASRRSLNSQLVMDIEHYLAHGRALTAEEANLKISSETQIFHVRLPMATYDALAISAKGAGRSVNKEVNALLSNLLKVGLPIPISIPPGMRFREDVVSAIRTAVAECFADGGGIVAVVGQSGFGKTVAASQYVERANGAAVLYSPPEDNLESIRLPALSGIAVIDEPHRYSNLAFVTETIGSSVAILLCQTQEQVAELVTRQPCRIIAMRPWLAH